MAIPATFTALIKLDLDLAMSHAEDPEARLAELIDELVAQLAAAKVQVARAFADARRAAPTTRQVGERSAPSSASCSETVEEWTRTLRALEAKLSHTRRMRTVLIARKPRIETCGALPASVADLRGEGAFEVFEPSDVDTTDGFGERSKS